MLPCRVFVSTPTGGLDVFILRCWAANGGAVFKSVCVVSGWSLDVERADV